jgi:protein-tyrosine kinase
MDKLAKALNKARAQRSQRINTAAVQRGAATTRGQTQHYDAPPAIDTSHAVKISDLVLERNRIIAHRTRSKEADTFRILRTQVLQAMTQGNMKTLGVTSPNYGDGKTTIAINLALSIALDLNQTVLLVDLDLRKPNITEYLGVTAPVGLTDYFTRDVPIADCLIRTSFERLSVLPAGRVLDHSSEVLGSPKIAALAEELRTRYPDRMIIYDLPPILAQDDPLVFLPHVDGVLLVVNEGNTRTHELRSAMRSLGNAHVLGTVLNNSQAENAHDTRPKRTHAA